MPHVPDLGRYPHARAEQVKHPQTQQQEVLGRPPQLLQEDVADEHVPDDADHQQGDEDGDGGRQATEHGVVELHEKGDVEGRLGARVERQGVGGRVVERHAG